MGKLREGLKALAKSIGVYEQIRDSKTRAYCALRDWDWAINWGIQHLLSEDSQAIVKFSGEFDERRLLEFITKEISAEASRDGSYQHGASSPLNLRALYILCRALRPVTVIETGVASGASSFVMLSALKENGCGRLFSIDLPPSEWEFVFPEYRQLARESLPSKKAPGWLVPPFLRDKWELITGDSKKELSALLAKLGKVDIFYHDSEHTRETMLWEYHTVWPYLKLGGVLTSDDVTWNTAFKEFRTEKKNEATSNRWFGFGMMRKL
jgi:predicted O-methyltransferase YrrM